MKITDSLEKVYTAMGGAEEFDKTSVANGIEQISEVAGSGSGGGGTANKFTLLPYKYGASGNNGGFIKSSSENVDTFYTYEEVLQIYNESGGYLCAVDTGGSGLSLDAATNVYFDAVGEVFTFSTVSLYVPDPNTGQSTSKMPIYAGTVRLSKSNGYSFEYHGWIFDVTNDD